MRLTAIYNDTTNVSCDEKDLVEQVLEYLRTNSYVDDCTEVKEDNQKESEEVCPSRQSALLQTQAKEKRSKLKILDHSYFYHSTHVAVIKHWFAGRFTALYSKQG